MYIPPQRHTYKASGKQNGCVLACSTNILGGTLFTSDSVPPDILFTGEYCPLPLTVSKPLKPCLAPTAYQLATFLNGTPCDIYPQTEAVKYRSENACYGFVYLQ